jgi:hypothetical protein
VSSSRSNAEYFSWAVSNFLLKKESGLQPPPGCHCCRTAPMWVLLASTAKLRSAAGSGWVRVATSVKVSLTSRKLCCMAGAKSSSSPPAARP